MKQAGRCVFAFVATIVLCVSFASAQRAATRPATAGSIAPVTINWLGDTSPKGLRESAGIMVNYLYRLDDIEKNHEAYANDDEIVASNAVKKLLKTEGRRLLDLRLS